MQSPDEIEARVEMLTSPEASPEQSVSDPTRQRTEIYMQGDDLREHIKLRDDADSKLQQTETIRQDKEEEKTTKRKLQKRSTSLLLRMQRHMRQWPPWQPTT